MEGQATEGGSKELENASPDAVGKKESSFESGKKRSRRELSQLSTPVLERGSRERKSVERLIISPDKAIKEFKIAKGDGTTLKDIPNVLFKLSKRRGADDVVQTLHKILYGKTAKANAIKGNILQFSGYVWSSDEEKEKAKVKERLERCIKESIFQISDLLDLNISRALKKEDAILKVFEFLESPYQTTDRLVEEKAKKSKRTPTKRKRVSGQKARKSLKSDAKASRKKIIDDEEDEDGGEANDDDVMESEPGQKNDDDYGSLGSSRKRRGRPLKKESKVPRKERKRPIKEAKKEKKIRIKLRAKEPTDENLQRAISEMLQDVDFSQVTFSDVLTQLGEKFSADLSHKKAYLKELIKAEVAKLVSEAADDEGDENNELEEDEGREDTDNQEDVRGAAVKAKEAADDDEDGGDEDDNAESGEDGEDAGGEEEEESDGEAAVHGGEGSDDEDAEGDGDGAAGEDEDADRDGDEDDVKDGGEDAGGEDGDGDGEHADVATQDGAEGAKGDDEANLVPADLEAVEEET